MKREYQEGPKPLDNFNKGMLTLSGIEGCRE